MPMQRYWLCLMVRFDMRIGRARRSFSSFVKHLLFIVLKNSFRRNLAATLCFIYGILLLSRSYYSSSSSENDVVYSENSENSYSSIIPVVATDSTPFIQVDIKDHTRFISKNETMPFYYPPKPTKPYDSTKTNAIVYLAQKSHKVYLRNSMALLSKSLDLLFRNYLLIDDHYRNVTVFIFHTGDFAESDLDEWERSGLYPTQCRQDGTLQLINLMGSPYWQTPSSEWQWQQQQQQQQHLMNDTDLMIRTHKWSNPRFNLGYRHM